METPAGSKPSVDESAGGGDGRVLVVAATAVTGSEIIERVRGETGDAKRELFVLAPSLTDSPFEHAMGSVDHAMVEARERLEVSVEALASSGFETRGAIGDSDPLLAIEDVLREEGVDSIILVTKSGENAHWLEGDLFERARQRFQPPIVHLTIEGEDHVADVESSGRGADPAPDAEVEGASENLPRFSLRDLIGIAVAIIGSLTAIVIAAGCEDGERLQRTTAEAGEGTDGACVAAFIIAGITTLINLAHVVGLVFFESVGYRGGPARGFAWLSLIGTPIAVVATILLAH